MYSTSVLCPLCAQTSFASIDALRCSLIKAANGPLACPICHELFLGLDKLTIHLFSHTNIMNSANNCNAITTPTTRYNQNKKINEKSKIQQFENSNMLDNTSSHCETHSNDEVGFDTTHHPWEKYTMKSNKVAAKADKIIVNKSNSTQQTQQVAAIVREDRGEPRGLDSCVQCDICEFTFRNIELRNMHIRLVHRNFKCHKNGNEGCKSQSSASATSPVNECRNTAIEHDFKCHLCAKTFKTKGSLRVHLKVVHLTGLPYVNNSQKLTICDRIRHKENKMLKSANPSSNDSHLQNETTNTSSTPADCISSSNVHFLSQLNPIAIGPSKSSVLNLKQPLAFQKNNLENFAVETSNVLLVLNTAGLNEIESHNPHSNAAVADAMPIITNDREVSSKVTYGLANVTENPKIWECDVCSKAFTTKYFLKKHKRLHTGEMPYTCELCARTFTFQQSYHKHLLYHSDEKPHVCSTCGRAFKELSTLHNHERIHSGEKPFKCEVCGKSFRQRVSFLVHTRIHTGVMPYKCEICQRSFRYKVSQRTHKCQALSSEELQKLQDENTADSVSENFIKAFLESSTANQADQHISQAQNSPTSNEIASINEKAATLNDEQALLAKTIDDIVVESCNKMGIGTAGFLVEPITNGNGGSMSPSEQLQNMRLYSPQMATPDLTGIGGDLTTFFLENSPGGSHLL